MLAAALSRAHAQGAALRVAVQHAWWLRWRAPPAAAILQRRPAILLHRDGRDQCVSLCGQGAPRRMTALVALRLPTNPRHLFHPAAWPALSGLLRRRDEPAAMCSSRQTAPADSWWVQALLPGAPGRAALLHAWPSPATANFPRFRPHQFAPRSTVAPCMPALRQRTQLHPHPGR